MKAIILAAGEGRRLRPLTNSKPKCLVRLGKKSLLDWQVESMHRCGIEDIIVVGGYRADKIVRPDVTYYVNHDYDTTNMVMTLWCAKDELDGELIISYGDIVYNDEVLQGVINAPYEISVVVDLDWQKYWQKRFPDPTKDAEAFKMDTQGKIKVIGQVAKKISDIDAGYIGLIKLQGKGTQIVKDSFINARVQARRGFKPWGAIRDFEMAYMTDMLQGLINEGQDVYAVKINGGWLEIDSFSDYTLAKELFADGRISHVC